MQNPALPAKGLARFRRVRSGAPTKDAASTAKRNRLIFAVASLLVLAGSYFGALKPEKARLEETKLLAEQAEANVVQLRGQLAHLRGLESRAGELQEQAARLNEALPVETELAKFILQVEDASNQAKLDWVSVNPSPPAASGAAPGLMESTVAMTASGTYAAIQDFLTRLENLQRAVKIGSLNITGGGQSPADPASKLQATIDLRMFLAPTAPPLPSEAVSPPASPAPASAVPASGSPRLTPPGPGTA